LSIEKDLTRIADALEKIAARHGEQSGLVAAAVAQVTKAETKAAAAEAAAQTPTEPKAEVKAEPVVEAVVEPEKSAPTVTVTLEEVRTALKEYRAIEGATAMLSVLKKHGEVDELSKLDPSKYAAVLAAVAETA
jgi:hypothetical protein